MFFHRLGEIRDRTFENRRYRPSGLKLAGPDSTMTPRLQNRLIIKRQSPLTIAEEQRRAFA